MISIAGISSVVERLVANEKVEVQIPLPAPKNMSDLAKKKCVPCEGNIPSFDLKKFINI